MRPVTKMCLLVICTVTACSAQYSESDRVVLPAGKTEADVTLQLRAPVAAGAAISDLRIEGLTGPKPVVAAPQITNDKATIHLSDLYFWGTASLRFALGGAAYNFTLQRGPAFATEEVHADAETHGQIWLYNFEKQPLTFRWRISSGADTICGLDDNGKPRRDCGSLSSWAQTTIAPAASDAIRFTPPSEWLGLLDSKRAAIVELRFGNDATSPLLSRTITIDLETHWRVPPVIPNVLRVLLWVTIGALLLLVAQVIIPNFRKCLLLETQVEVLQERLRAISSDIGSRLYTRCQQEIDSFTQALAMRRGDHKTRWYELTRNRLALAWNPAEVNRLIGILPRIESRVSLTEKLDERLSAMMDSNPRDLPPSLYWNRAQQIANVRAVLSRQFLTEGDEKSAAASLDLLADPEASLKQFRADLELRVAALRRQFPLDPLKTRYPNLIKDLNGCAELLDKDSPAPDDTWTIDELIARDLAAVRLAAVAKMIWIECWLKDLVMQSRILKLLCSDDPARLEEAERNIAMLAQDVSEDQVKATLAAGRWDVFAEPATITDQDVLRLSFAFRDVDIDQSAAKSLFRCYWHIEFSPNKKKPKKDTGTNTDSAIEKQIVEKDKDEKEKPEERRAPCDPDDDDIYETGWQAQFIPARGEIRITPQIYDADGNELTIMTTEQRARGKGIVCFRVARRPNFAFKRLWRGLIDSAVTALVPVVTVAVTQAQNGGDLTFDKLVLLGFTSQAIRAAVVPESVTTTGQVPPVKPVSTVPPTQPPGASATAASARPAAPAPVIPATDLNANAPKPNGPKPPAQGEGPQGGPAPNPKPNA